MALINSSIRISSHLLLSSDSTITSCSSSTISSPCDSASAAPLWAFLIGHHSVTLRTACLTLCNLAVPAADATNELEAELAAVAATLPSPLFIAGVWSKTVPLGDALLASLPSLLPLISKQLPSAMTAALLLSLQSAAAAAAQPSLLLTPLSVCPSTADRSLPHTVMSGAEEASFWSSFTAFHLSVSLCFPTPYWPSPADASFLLSPRRAPTPNFSPRLDAFVACLSSASSLAFYIPSYDLLLPPGALASDADDSSNCSRRSFRDELPPRDSSNRGKKQQKASHNAAVLPALSSSSLLSDSIEVELLSAPPPCSSTATSAPTLRPLSCTSLSCVWPSALYLAQQAESLPVIISGLLAVLRQRAAEMRAAASARHQCFRSFHFLPPSLPHPLVITFPTDGDEEELAAMRAQWHRRFRLHAARPLLRPINAIQLPTRYASASAPAFSSAHSLLSSLPSLRGKLLSPHLAVPPPASCSPSSRLRLHVSSCPYLYYHAHDNSNDTGWECAYRTAQTICSAVMLCALPSSAATSPSAALLLLPPPISAMQSTLRITNPRAWIGAADVAAVLERYADAQCRILHPPDGADAAERSFNSQLAAYFDSEGGIALIGAGVLAYGLAGIAWEEEEERGRVECRYLIVDPHYAGEDDLQAMLSGGWVGWRSRADVFLPGQLYSVCLPCMPNTV